VKTCSDGNCISCPANISFCSQCTSGWKVGSRGSCERDVCTISNCLQCNGASTCSVCALQYQLSSDAKSCLASCLTAVPNCETCSNTTACLTCGSGYTLSNASCTPVCSIASCLLCASKTTCMACAPGTLMGYSSLTCDWDCGINGCRSCSSATTCSACYPGYTLAADSQRCLIVCPEGYYLKDGACTFCLGNYCQLCATTGQCLACRDLFYLNQTDYNCYQCSNIDLYCYTCQSTAAVCTSCVEGFFLSANKCILVGTCAISNCAACYYSLNASTCLLCNPGYTLGGSNTTCSPISCPGEQFLIGSVCTCGIGAYAWNSKCKSCSKNCLACNSQLCSSCVTGYYPKGTDCKKCSQNCQSCTQTTCLACVAPYILHNGNCSRQSDSKTSVSVSSTGAFIACPAGCKTCDLSTTGAKICTAASDGYVLIGQSLSKCDPSCKTCTGSASTNKNSNCLSCYNGFNIVGGNCKKCTDANALTCSPNNPSFSLTCLSGFTPSSGGVCSACSSNCVKCDINKAGSCDSEGCGTGFAQYGSSLLCVACFNGCAGCDSDPNSCTSCLESQYLSNGKCLPCSANCLSCSNSSSCSKCQQGYTPTSSGSCGVPPGLPCVNYDASLTCTACDTTYELSSGKCLVSSSCNSTGNCSTCNYNQYLSSGNCYTCPPLPNCSSCSLINSSLCFDCNKGYYLDASSICVACATGCSSCASSAQCLTASDGYYAISTLNGTLSGSVAACASNCLTCNTQATLCTSCKTGFTLQGSQCLQDFNYEINILGALIGLDVTNMTSTLETALFLQIFSLFLDEVAKVLKFNNLGSFQQNSVFKSLVRGSLAASVNVNGGSIDSGSIAGLSNLSTVSVLNVNSNSNNPPNTSDGSSRLVVILAIALPIGFLRTFFLI
jgi:proprotein convertase subtilisin/kexin type 5